MTVNTPASNDDTEFESTPIPGPPGATTDNTLRQMMMTEYMRRLGEQRTRQDEWIEMRMQKPLNL